MLLPCLLFATLSVPLVGQERQSTAERVMAEEGLRPEDFTPPPEAKPAKKQPAAVPDPPVPAGPAVGEPGAAGEGKEEQPVKAEEVTGPGIFLVRGEEAWQAACDAGWKFAPHGARGACDGRGSFAEMAPGVKTSVVEGPVMMQMSTRPGWSMLSQNTFSMFADETGQPKRLAPGWRVLDVQVEGQNWQWLRKPQRGALSPGFSIVITGVRSQQLASVATLKHLVLAGPPSAKDWRAAFATGKAEPRRAAAR